MVSRPADDQQLAERARRGDAAAFEDLVRRHQPIAFRTAFVLRGSAADAEDAAQEAFVKAWRALRALPRRRAVPALAAGDRRQRGAQPPPRGGPPRGAGRAGGRRGGADPPPDGPLADGARCASARGARGALAPLGERDRTVLALRYVLDLPEREIAAVLGCRPGTVKSRLSRALERLREEVAA